jgi:phosphomannomutase
MSSDPEVSSTRAKHRTFTASEAQKQKITRALNDAVVKAGFTAERTWGPLVEDRESQITFSALGQQAPLEAKKDWDPDFAKRKAIKALLDVTLPDFPVRLGGSTSIDVTLPGIDKAYGIHKLRDVLHIDIAEMLYVGDALFPGGNDYPSSKWSARAWQTWCRQTPNGRRRAAAATYARNASSALVSTSVPAIVTGRSP